MSRCFELILFTASKRIYADKLMVSKCWKYVPHPIFTHSPISIKSNVSFSNPHCKSSLRAIHKKWFLKIFYSYAFPSFPTYALGLYLKSVSPSVSKFSLNNTLLGRLVRNSQIIYPHYNPIHKCWQSKLNRPITSIPLKTYELVLLDLNVKQSVYDFLPEVLIKTRTCVWNFWNRESF